MLLILLVVIVVIGVLMFNRRKGLLRMVKIFSLAEMLEGSPFKLLSEVEPELEFGFKVPTGFHACPAAWNWGRTNEFQAQLLRMSYYEKKHFI